jgi:heme/copper-type cytochrome/quinol oxidase subunit 3
MVEYYFIFFDALYLWGTICYFFCAIYWLLLAIWRIQNPWIPVKNAIGALTLLISYSGILVIAGVGIIEFSDSLTKEDIRMMQEATSTCALLGIMLVVAYMALKYRAP